MPITGDFSIDFTYDHPDPDHFILEQSDDGVSGWALFENLAGTERETSNGAVSGKWYRVAAFDSGDGQVSEWSSSVQAS